MIEQDFIGPQDLSAIHRMERQMERVPEENDSWDIMKLQEKAKTLKQPNKVMEYMHDQHKKAFMETLEVFRRMALVFDKEKKPTKAAKRLLQWVEDNMERQDYAMLNMQVMKAMLLLDDSTADRNSRKMLLNFPYTEYDDRNRKLELNYKHNV